MKLTRLDDDCLNKIDCPTIYRTYRGTFVVQGPIVRDVEALTRLNLPPGETAVEIPLSLVRKVWGDAV